MTGVPFSPAVVTWLAGAICGCAVMIAAIRAGSKRKRSRRVLDFHLRMETEWKNARTRMYLTGPIGPQAGRSHADRRATEAGGRLPLVSATTDEGPPVLSGSEVFDSLGGSTKYSKFQETATTTSTNPDFLRYIGGKVK